MSFRFNFASLSFHQERLLRHYLQYWLFVFLLSNPLFHLHLFFLPPTVTDSFFSSDLITHLSLYEVLWQWFKRQQKVIYIYPIILCIKCHHLPSPSLPLHYNSIIHKQRGSGKIKKRIHLYSFLIIKNFTVVLFVYSVVTFLYNKHFYSSNLFLYYCFVIVSYWTFYFPVLICVSLSRLQHRETSSYTTLECRKKSA